MQLPLVSVICLCHNHGPFVRQSLNSVLAQTYPALELLVVDDASTDDSAAQIRAFVAEHPETNAIFLRENVGNCRAFNLALHQARGEFILDLAADDVLRPDRLARQIEGFGEAGEAVGVLFHNAAFIDETGRQTGTYFPVNGSGKTPTAVPEGDLFAALLRHRPVCAPTMLVRRTIFDELGGYDETLAYEDFDFWVRSARNWQYGFQNEILTEKRMLRTSLGSQFYNARNPLLPSALAVCRKAETLCRTDDERSALRFRVRYFLRQCWYMHHFALAEGFFGLLGKPGPLSWFVLVACRARVPVHRFYRFYLRLINWFRVQSSGFRSDSATKTLNPKL